VKAVRGLRMILLDVARSMSDLGSSFFKKV